MTDHEIGYLICVMMIAAAVCWYVYLEIKIRSLR